MLFLDERQKEERRIKIHDNRTKRTRSGSGSGDGLGARPGDLTGPSLGTGFSDLSQDTMSVVLPPQAASQAGPHAGSQVGSHTGPQVGSHIVPQAGPHTMPQAGPSDLSGQTGPQAGPSAGPSAAAGQPPDTFSHLMAGIIDPERYSNMTEINKDKLLEVIQAFKVSFDLPIEKKVVPDPSNADFLNMADASVRRLVKMAKQITGFKKVSQEDQVALLKGAVLEVLVLRSIKMFDVKAMQWNIPKSGSLTRISPDMVQKMNSESAVFMKQYGGFATSVLSTTRRDNVVLMMLVVLCVLSPDRAGITDRAEVERIQEEYAQVLKEYLNINFPRDKVMFARVLQKLADIRELHDVHSKMLKNSNLTELEPLMMEIFDLSS